MTIDQSIDVVKSLMMLCLQVALPFLLSAMIIGLFISFFQAITSLQEQTLTFVPKILAMLGVLLLLGPWLGGSMIEFTRQLFESIPLMSF